MKEMAGKGPRGPAAPKGASMGPQANAFSKQAAGGMASTAQKAGAHKVPTGPKSPRVRPPAGSQFQGAKTPMPMAGRKHKPTTLPDS